MALYMIGLGVNDIRDISVKGINYARECAVVYFEAYTGKFNSSVKEMEAVLGKKIIPADRELVEKRAEEILEQAKNKHAAFLVVGDPMSATTHIDLMMRAKKKNIAVHVIHGSSIFSAVGTTGLQLYKFGKTASIPYPKEGFEPTVYYDVLKKNLDSGCHTLFLLDVDAENEKYMTVNEAVQLLLKAEEKKKEKVFSKQTLCVGCARLGSDDFAIKSGKASELLKFDFGRPAHCLIVPAKMHFMEEEALAMWK